MTCQGQDHSSVIFKANLNGRESITNYFELRENSKCSSSFKLEKCNQGKPKCVLIFFYLIHFS